MATHGPPPTDQYNAFAGEYAKMEDLPGEILVAQCISRVLRRINVTGKRILDVGGGSGLYARLAVDLGASSVVVVDVSSGMCQVGTEVESKLRPNNPKIEYHVADCSKPLAEAGIDLPHESFDLVMANWTLCYNDTKASLQGMWNNIITYLKPGGSFMGTLDLHIHARSAQGQYGITHTILDQTENGYNFQITAHTKPEIKFRSFSLQPLSLYKSVPESLGMTKVVFENATKEDLWEGQSEEYWKDMLEDPFFKLCTAVKPKDA